MQFDNMYTEFSKSPTLLLSSNYEPEFWKTAKHVFSQFEEVLFWFKTFWIRVLLKGNFKLLIMEMVLVTY